ncbi:hypothetical protein [Prosthecobacter dejongeii]|uniref:Uncharacterized protein n=1 Tax=Prosthecobacter dejongeii TaxID=48465 RepID=A0A7W7YJV7_9BACT|nr:hypothetical protein [Prosthecobacter dejongeii]MBB5037417.1 hypothetical protein [Prosthecobacter dejongeii]
MFFRPLHTFKDEMLSLDRDLETGLRYLCIPVFDGNVQSSEHYALTAEEFDLLTVDAAAREAMAGRCRARLEDARLAEPPVLPRGEPCLPEGFRGGALINHYPSRDGLRDARVLKVFWNEQFSLACDLISREFYLDIVVLLPTGASGMTVSECYRLTPEEVRRVRHDHAALIHLAAKCQTHHNDAQLMSPPLVQRGIPCHVGVWP